MAATVSSNATSIASIAAIVTAIVGAVGAAFAAISVFRTSQTDSESSEAIVAQKSLEDRLKELSDSMRNSAKLVEQVSAELNARAVTAKKLQEDAKAAEALAAINKDQADAIRRLMDVELEGAAKRIRRDSVVIGIASFIAGGGVSLLVTLLVHPLS